MSRPIFAAVIVASAVLLTGCSTDPLAPKAFGEIESLYQPPTNIEEFIGIAQEATVQVLCEDGVEEYPFSGSGFHIKVGDERYIITNAHVIADCIDQGDLWVYDKDQNLHVVELLAYRHVTYWQGDWDVAVLSGREFGPALALAPQAPEPGHWSMAVGWPSVGGDWYQQVAMGEVLGLAVNRTIVTSVVGAKGMSGGPMLNSRGEVIGVHYASSGDSSRRSLSQPLGNLCEVAFKCDQDKKPLTPLEIPDHPIKTYIETED